MIGHIKKESVNLLWFSVLSSRLWMGSDHTDADGGSVWTPVAVVMCDSRQDCACNRGWSGSVLHLLRRKPAAQLWMRILTRLTGIVAHREIHISADLRVARQCAETGTWGLLLASGGNTKLFNGCKELKHALHLKHGNMVHDQYNASQGRNYNKLNNINA